MSNLSTVMIVIVVVIAVFLINIGVVVKINPDQETDHETDQDEQINKLIAQITALNKENLRMQKCISSMGDS